MAAAAGMLASLLPHAALAQAVTGAPGSGGGAPFDYAGAVAAPLPMATAAPPSLLDTLLAKQQPRRGEAGTVPGRTGDGRLQAVRLAAPLALGCGGVGSQEYGTSQHVFTTSRVNAAGNETTRFIRTAPPAGCSTTMAPAPSAARRHW